MEKKDGLLYLDKYVHVRFGPSVRLIGGKPSEGCIAITGSGLVCVMILQADETVVTGTEILGQYRSRLKVVDLCYGKSRCQLRPVLFSLVLLGIEDRNRAFISFPFNSNKTRATWCRTSKAFRGTILR